MPERNLPFFEMFAKYHPTSALAAQLETWLVTGAVMDSHSRTIEVKLLCADLPAPALLDQVGREVSQIYGLRGVTFRPACPQAPAGVEEPMPPPPGEEDAPPPPEDADVPPWRRLCRRLGRHPPPQRWSRPLSLRNRQVGLPLRKRISPSRKNSSARPRPCGSRP